MGDPRRIAFVKLLQRARAATGEDKPGPALLAYEALLLARHPAPSPSVSRGAARTALRCAVCRCGWDEGTYDLDCECRCHTDPTYKPTEPAPSPRSEAESDCVCGHPYLAHVGVHHGCIGIDCGPGCVDECQGAGCHCTRYRPRAPVPAESATKGEEDGR